MIEGQSDFISGDVVNGNEGVLNCPVGTLNEDQNQSIEVDGIDQPDNDLDNSVEEKEEGDSDDDDESIEETPPLLKYRRLDKLPSRFFTKDPVSTFHANENVLIFATHSGILHLCHPNFTPIRTFKAHNSSVFSIECDGEHFISGSIDGTVIIGSILNNDVNKYDFKRPIQAVAFDRTYSKTNGFLCGGTQGQLLYCTKNWLGQRSDFTIDDNNGTITMIKTIDDIVIWCNDRGVNMAQITTKQELNHIPTPKEFQQPELYWPRIHKIDENRLLLAWVNHLWVFRVSISENQSVKPLVSAAASFKSIYSDKKVEIENYMKLDDTMIAGISDFNDNLMILNYIPRAGKTFSPPELKILDRNTLDELSVDEIELKNYQGLSLNDYHLQFSGNKSWILLSSNDAIIVEEFTLHDRLEWYLNRQLYLSAWELGGFWLDKYEKLFIANKQLDQYYVSSQWENLIEFMARSLAISDEKDDEVYIQKLVKEWDKWLGKLKEKGHLKNATEIIPTTSFLNGFYQVDEKFYETLLSDYLHDNETKKFLNCLNEWDHSLFNLNDIKLQMDNYLNMWDKDHRNINLVNNEEINLITELRKKYIEICLEIDEPKDCVPYKIKLKDPYLLEFLDQFHLIKLFLNQIPEIILISVPPEFLKSDNLREMEGNSFLKTNIQILVENSHEISPSSIVKVMEGAGMDIINYLYLEELGKVDKLFIKDFEDDMIKLYAKFKPELLYEFISKHKNYSIDKAIEVCEEYKCSEELVYMFSKVGQNEKALTIIVDELKDPAMAINFVHKIGDQSLWDFLLDYTMSRSDFIKALLISAGDWIDPIPVVSRIPKGVEIQGLKSALLNITANGQLDEYIYSLIKRIITFEELSIGDEYRNVRITGALIDKENLERVQSVSNSSFVKYTFKKGIYEEAELIGSNFKSQGNKVTHKSYIKLKLSKNENQLV